VRFVYSDSPPFLLINEDVRDLVPGESVHFLTQMVTWLEA